MFYRSLCPQILIRLLGLPLPGFHGHFILPSVGTQMASYRFWRASKMGHQLWVAGTGSCCVTPWEQLTEIIIMGHEHGVPNREPQIPAASRSHGFAALPFAAVFCECTMGQILQWCWFLLSPASTDHLFNLPDFFNQRPQRNVVSNQKAQRNAVPMPLHILCSPRWAQSQYQHPQRAQANCVSPSRSQCSVAWANQEGPCAAMSLFRFCMLVFPDARECDVPHGDWFFGVAECWECFWGCWPSRASRVLLVLP